MKTNGLPPAIGTTGLLNNDRATDEELAELFDMTVDELYETALDDGKILNHQVCEGVWQKYGSSRGGEWTFNKDPEE